ncbi:MAG TPA: DUF3127 domain-containing protein [Saprospiraceae bacterium]|nr:DUF3127 domain-containing protein [Saprospiraceae bacterium]
MSFEIEGKLHMVFTTEQKSESFRTREFVIETMQGSYPQYIKFQLTQDRCDILDSYKTGQQIKVYFDLRGRQWQDKYFTNLQAWRIEVVGETQAAPMPGQREVAHSSNGGSAKSPGALDNPEAGVDDFDDLPF